MHNYHVDFTRSHHFVAGLEHAAGKDGKVKVETYYQSLFNVPVETRKGSSYSAMDQGSSYSRDFPDTLQNTGTGYNYGLEMTIEKKLPAGIYGMISASVFDSKAKGNDGVYRNTDYNTGYAINVLGGYERKSGRHGTFIAGVKLTFAGGRWYSPVDTAASRAYGDAVVVDGNRNTIRLPAYFRADVKLGMRINAQRLAHEIGLDLVNLLNTKNVLSYAWSYDQATMGKEPFSYQYQLGFLPIFYYRVDFGRRKG